MKLIVKKRICGNHANCIYCLHVHSC